MLSQWGGMWCLRALEGPHQSGGWPWEPAVPGQQTRLVHTPKPRGHDGCLRQGHGCRAARCSALPFVGKEQAGNSASQEELSPRSAFLPRNEPLGLSLQLP